MLCSLSRTVLRRVTRYNILINEIKQRQPRCFLQILLRQGVPQIAVSTSTSGEPEQRQAASEIKGYDQEDLAASEKTKEVRLQNVDQGTYTELAERNSNRLSNNVDDSAIEIPGPFDKCKEDLSYLGPYTYPTFNIATYVNGSKSLQEMVNLGIDFHYLKFKKGGIKLLLPLDFDINVKPYVHFLHDHGVPDEMIGSVITENPRILHTEMDKLIETINYFESHGFDKEMIATIITNAPKCLSIGIIHIDSVLGYFQTDLKLTDKEIRAAAVTCPKIITMDVGRFQERTNCITDQLGFTPEECKALFCHTPNIWIFTQKFLLSNFNYLHNRVKLSHDTIIKHAQLLLCELSRLQNRHQFLIELKRAQYDPTKPLYISPMYLGITNDEEFCNEVAHCDIETFDLFLKTL